MALWLAVARPLIMDLSRGPGKLIKLLRVSRRLNHAPVHAERNRQVTGELLPPHCKIVLFPMFDVLLAVLALR